MRLDFQSSQQPKEHNDGKSGDDSGKPPAAEGIVNLGPLQDSLQAKLNLLRNAGRRFQRPDCISDLKRADDYLPNSGTRATNGADRVQGYGEGCRIYNPASGSSIAKSILLPMAESETSGRDDWEEALLLRFAPFGEPPGHCEEL
jgi:hypothetical protein